jgi:hypothetical protein
VRARTPAARDGTTEALEAAAARKPLLARVITTLQRCVRRLRLMMRSHLIFWLERPKPKFSPSF